jgi:endonuclease-3
MKPSTPPVETAAARARGLVGELARLYPDPRCPLDFQNPVQLLVATILSAQCTDALVNKVTPALFARFPDAHAFANADPGEVEQLIRRIGFFRTKTKYVIGCCRQIVERHGGEAPRTIEELTALPGVGRKTANVLLGNAYGTAGIAVDTHVARLSRRLALSVKKNPVLIERDLNALVPREEWRLFGLRLVYHGRRVCRSRKPRCEECGLAELCPKVGVGQAKDKGAAKPGTVAGQGRGKQRSARAGKERKAPAEQPAAAPAEQAAASDRRERA